jgi:DNA-binding GntR family transcriptional regulator
MPKKISSVNDVKKPHKTERRVFRDEIRERLIADILSGRLPPGSRIVETRLAQQFGVSQAPVREALRDLELFGFVVSSPFRGTQVRKIESRDLLEIYPIRAALEGVAARAAAVRIDDAALGRMADLVAAMREAAGRNNRDALASADTAFHQAIIHASGNKMLEHVWGTMRLAITTAVTYTMARRSLLELAERHVPVLEALRSRDPVLAEAAIRRHIDEPREWVSNVIKEEQQQRAESGADAEAAG